MIFCWVKNGCKTRFLGFRVGDGSECRVVVGVVFLLFFFRLDDGK